MPVSYAEARNMVFHEQAGLGGCYRHEEFDLREAKR
jgi:hypothetical protein